MNNFAKLKSWVDDDPTDLVNDAIRYDSIAGLCEKLWFNAYFLSSAEKRNPELFTGPINPAFVVAWRDYEQRYENLVSWISACMTLGELTTGGEALFDMNGDPPKPPSWEERWTKAASEADEKVLALDFADVLYAASLTH